MVRVETKNVIKENGEPRLQTPHNEQDLLCYCALTQNSALMYSSSEVVSNVSISQ